MKFRAYAPATIGNFAAGFDVLGAALAPLDGSLWGDVVMAEAPPGGRRARTSLRLEGPFATALPKNPKDNLVWHCFELFTRRLRRYGLEPAAVKLTLYKNLPLCSGLGSSASSVVAALLALNTYFCKPFSSETLLELGGLAEGIACGAVHYDNVAPALLGGLQLLVPGECAKACRLPFFDRFVLAVVHPDLEVATAKARRVLPRSLPLSLATDAWGNLAGLVHALHSRDRELFAETLRDLVAEPHRRKLVKGFAGVQRAALENGALGCSLSGSGPSLFAVANSQRGAQRILQAMRASFAKQHIPSTGRLCRLDAAGARLLPET